MKKIVGLLFIIYSLIGISANLQSPFALNQRSVLLCVTKHSLNQRNVETQIANEDADSTTIEFESTEQEKTEKIKPANSSFERREMQVIPHSNLLPQFCGLPPPSQLSKI
jgi:hypothetical protein